MPESKGREQAELKKKSARKASVNAVRAENRKKQTLSNRRGWVVPTFLTLLLVGVLWLVVYYVTTSTGITVPGMTALGNWNMLIGMGLMAASFAVATQWK
ncbi:cell division protein CrgA [Propioniciclava soli]|uniref:Cell division protein CrgA n=1 Tax=Propioniciclava soli TaxID=2775081 RepID=A0ABZ3C5M6_9ACTN